MVPVRKASRGCCLTKDLRESTAAAQKHTDNQTHVHKAFLASTLGEAYEHSEVAAFLHSYTLYVERSLQVVSDMIAPHVISQLCRDTASTTTDASSGTMEFSCKVVGLLQQEILNHKQSLDGVVDKIIESANFENRHDPTTRQSCRHLVFAILGLSTMLFKPTGSKPSDMLETLQRNGDAEKHSVIPVDMCERPIRTLLMRLKALPTGASTSTLSMPSNETADSGNSDAEALLSANLSFSSLKAIGSMSIEWVDSMDNHLDFDPDRRALSLFRYPSFCAASRTTGSPTSILAKIISSRSGPGDTHSGPSSEAVLSHSREILRSYRILFAQDKKSRGLYWSTIRPSLRKDNQFDPFLDDLCGRRISAIQLRYPTLRTVLDVQGSVFRSQEFPHYGGRLRTLQRHIDRHRPRRILDLWRDRRDPEKILTLWAVLIFGMISIVLSLVQTILNGVQVWMAYKQVQQS